FRFADVTSITIGTGGGADTVTLDFTGGNVIPEFGIAYDGGGRGPDTLNAIADANFTLGDDQLSVAGFGQVALTSVEEANLTGGAGDNAFIVSDWSGTGTIDGAGGTDRVTAANGGDFTLGNGFLDRTNRGRLNLQSIEQTN